MRLEHLSEDELVLCYYSLEQGEELEAAQAHLNQCEKCRQELGSLASTLNVVDEWAIPERDAAYGSQVWETLSPRLGVSEPVREPWWKAWFNWSSLGWRGLAAAGAVAGLMVISFSVGRRFPNGPESPKVEVAKSEETSRERFLLVTLNDHLEASQRVLTEVSNTSTGESDFERSTAEELVAANRLYRQSAKQVGDRGTAMLLEDLERYLLEAAHASPMELKILQQRMKEDDILFQLRVLNSQLKQKQRKLLPVVSN